MEEHGIVHYTTKSRQKIGLVERAIRSIAHLVGIWCRKKGTYRFINDLNGILANYNTRTPMRANGGLSPEEGLKPENKDRIYKARYGTEGLGLHTPFFFGLNQR